MIRKQLSIALGFLILATPAFGQFIENATIKGQLKLPSEQASSATYLDSQKQVKGSSLVSKTELETLDGASGNIQTQIDAKASDASVVHKTGDESVSGVKTLTGKLVASSTSNGAHPCPSMTDTQMLAIPSPLNGDCVTNTTLNTWLVYDTSTSLWKEVGGGGGISTWLTATVYKAGDVTINSNRIYQAQSNHTSGTFATDLAGGKWVALAGDVSNATGILPMANGGTNKAMTPVAGGVVYTDADSQEVAPAGTAGQVLQSNGTSAPSYVNKSVSGKAQNKTAVTVEEIQVPNSQFTQTATNKQLIDNCGTSNNLLENCSFEHMTTGSGWSSSVTGTATASYGSNPTTTGELGLKQGTWSCAGGASGGTCLFYQDALTSKSIPSIVYGYVSATNKDAAQFVSRSNGVNDKAITLQQTSEFPYKIPGTLGTTSTGVGVLVTVPASTTYTGTIDNMIVAAQDVKQDVPLQETQGSRIVGGVFTASSNFGGAFTTTYGTTGLYSYDSGTGIYTALKDITVDLTIYVVLNSATSVVPEILFSGNVATSAHSPSVSIQRASISGSSFVAKGNTFLVRNIQGTGSQYVVNVTANSVVNSSVYTSTVSNAGGISNIIFNSNPVAPRGFASAMNKTFGKSSGDYQGSDYFALYSVLWAQGGTSTTAGDPYTISSAKGASALADWDAGKTIKVDYVTNSPYIRGAGTGLTLGAYRDSDNKAHNHNLLGSNVNTGTLVNLSPGTAAVLGAINGNTGLTYYNTAPANGNKWVQDSGGTESHPKEVALNVWIQYQSYDVIIGSFQDLKAVTARASSAVAQSIPNSTVTTITWDSTKSFDTNSALNTSTGVFTAPMDGYYKVDASLALSNNTVATFIAYLNRSGTIVSQAQVLTTATAFAYTAKINDVVYLTAGQTLSIQANHNSGAARTLSGVAVENYFSISKVGAGTP